MKNFLNKIFSNKVLVKNFTSLSLLQFTNYLFPLLTFPYLVRVLGPEKYGLINFAAAFTGYFAILTDYGFNLSATQEISVNREDKEKILETFSSVLSAKLFLYAVSTVIFIICMVLFGVFKNDLFVFIVSYSGLLGTVIFPLWYFQGTEKMNFIFFINFIIKLITVITIFLFITYSADYLLLIAFYSAGQLIYGFVGLLIVRMKFGLKFSLPKFKNVFNQLRNGKNYFVSSLSINVVTSSNVFILGLFADKNIVGYFAAADKIRLAFQSLLGPLFTSTFPYVTNLAKKSLDEFYSFNKNSFKLTLVMGTSIFLILYFSAEYLGVFVLGEKYHDSIIILKLISIVPLLYGISNFLGVQILLPLNYSKKYASIMITTLAVHLFLSILLVYNFQAFGSATALVFSEIFLIFLLLLTVKKIDKTFKNNK